MPQGEPRQGELYRHFKNKMYQIVAIAKHSETREKLVIYQALYGDYSVYARPYEMFISEVDHIKYPNVKEKFRFTFVDKNTLPESCPDKNTLPEICPDINTLSENCPEQNGLLPETSEIKLAKTNALDNKPAEMKKIKTVDDYFMDFLDADEMEKKYDCLLMMKEDMTDLLIDNMAASLDASIDDGPIDFRYDALKQVIKTKMKYELNR